MESRPFPPVKLGTLRPMSRSRLIALVLAVALISGHAGGLQVLAWASMLATRAPVRGWAPAVESTFSGQDPCAMCRVILVVHDLATVQAADLGKSTGLVQPTGKSGVSEVKAPEKPDKGPDSWPAIDLVPEQARCPGAPLLTRDSGLGGAQFRPRPEPPPPRIG